MRTLSYTELPLTNDSRQVFTVDVVIDGIALHARVEIRYMSAMDQWVISIWDHATSVLLVNQVPLICSYGELNDLLLPFRYIRDGVGVGSLFVLRNTDEPSTENPAKGNLTEFQVLFGDSFVPELEESA